MFFVQGFFEIFETLLSYFSNTLSFVRIGAFAVSHAAMMEVVLMLAGAESGSPNWIVVVLGNLFVCGMEGLIVGIQVLRLEYYEMFSRFYKGSGRAFDPYTKTQTTKQKRSYHPIRILSDRGKEPKKIQTCHRNECLFLLWRIRDHFHHDVCRSTGTCR